MATRFLATKESDFAQLWKEGIVKAGDRGTLIARGFVGPARWIKTPVSIEHQKNTLNMAPRVFLGTPDDYSTIPPELIENEANGLNAVYHGKEDKALMAGGECAQRVEDLPAVKDLVDRIMEEASDIVESFKKQFLVP